MNLKFFPLQKYKKSFSPIKGYFSLKSEVIVSRISFSTLPVNVDTKNPFVSTQFSLNLNSSKSSPLLSNRKTYTVFSDLFCEDFDFPEKKVN